MRISLFRMASVADNVALISGQVNEAYQVAGRYRAVNPPRLVAVSKTKPKEAILEAYKAGHRVFGENYVHELVEKSKDPDILSLCPDIEWHFIGNCQSNKAKDLMKCPRLTTVETVTSTKLASKLNNQATSPVDIFVQVNTSGEANKNGLEPVQVLEAVKFIMENCSNLKFKGLMTIGNLDNSIAASDSGENPDFKLLAETRHKVAAALEREETELELSMGMSKDYKEAILMGSTNVRVGSSIFGAREYKVSAAPPPAKETETSEGVVNLGGVSVETVTNRMEQVSF